MTIREYNGKLAGNFTRATHEDIRRIWSELWWFPFPEDFFAGG